MVVSDWTTWTLVWVALAGRMNCEVGGWGNKWREKKFI
jgi:hypothetical protein